MFVCPEKVLEGDIKYTLEQEAPIDDLSPAEVTQAAAYKRGNDEMEAMIDRLDELNFSSLWGKNIEEIIEDVTHGPSPDSLKTSLLYNLMARGLLNKTPSQVQAIHCWQTPVHR